MVVTGLENNYYLAGNDIWLEVGGFLEPAQKLEITCVNNTTAEVLRTLVSYASPENVFKFCVSEPVRALFPETTHTLNNNLQQISIGLKVIFENLETLPEEHTVTKYFIRGHRVKSGIKSWNLQDTEPLVIQPWTFWQGLEVTRYAQRLQGGTISNYVPTDARFMTPRFCGGFKLVKFLNSLGGYQYYLFEAWTLLTSSDTLGAVVRNPTSLRDSNFRSSGTEYTDEIELSTVVPKEAAAVLADLAKSSEVFIYDPEGVDANSLWTRVLNEGNSLDLLGRRVGSEVKLIFKFMDTNSIWL